MPRSKEKMQSIKDQRKNTKNKISKVSQSFGEPFEIFNLRFLWILFLGILVLFDNL
jgi:hypothetical protein